MGTWAFLHLGFTALVLVKELPQADIEEEQAEQFSENAGVQPIGKPSGQGRGDQPCQDRGEDGLFLQQPVFVVGGEGCGGGREEIQEVDALFQ